MGSSSSKTKLRVVLETPTVRTGATVVGQICLDVAKPIAMPVSLDLEYTCTERVSRQTIHSNWENATEDTHECIQVFHLAFTEPIAIGQSTYPFQFVLPASLPPSVVLQRFHGVSSSYANVADVDIKHVLTASITSNGWVRLRNQKGIRVLSSHVPIARSIEGSNTKHVKILGFEQGECEITLFTDKNVFAHRDVAHVEVQVANRSTSSSSVKVELRLVQVVGLMNDNKEVPMNRHICTREVGEISADENLQQLVQLPIVNERDGQRLTPTFNGKQSSCRYYLEVRCKFSFLRTGELMVPITIVPSAAVPTATIVADSASIPTAQPVAASKSV